MQPAKPPPPRLNLGACPGACLAALPLGLLVAVPPSPPIVDSILHGALDARPQASPLCRDVPPLCLARGRLHVAVLHSSPPLGSATEALSLPRGTSTDPRLTSRTTSLPALPARQLSPSLSPRSRQQLPLEVDACNLRNRHTRGWTSPTGPSELSFVSTPPAAVGRRTREVSERQREPRALLADRFPASKRSQ